MKLRFDRLISLETKLNETLSIPAGELWKVMYGTPSSSGAGIRITDFKDVEHITLAGPLQLDCSRGKLTGIAFKVVDN